VAAKPAYTETRAAQLGGVGGRRPSGAVSARAGKGGCSRSRIGPKPQARHRRWPLGRPARSTRVRTGPVRRTRALSRNAPGVRWRSANRPPPWRPMAASSVGLQFASTRVSRAERSRMSPLGLTSRNPIPSIAVTDHALIPTVCAADAGATHASSVLGVGDHTGFRRC
jgi:hypothetical protein